MPPNKDKYLNAILVYRKDTKDVSGSPGFKKSNILKDSINNFFSKISILINKIVNPTKAAGMQKDYESKKNLSSTKKSINSLFEKKKDKQPPLHSKDESKADRSNKKNPKNK